MASQLPLFKIDPKTMAMEKQPNTSWEAAEKARRSASKTMWKVGKTLLELGPLTDLELHIQCCARYGPRPESSYRKRRTDLTSRGLVYDSGLRKVEEGQSRVQWTLTELGKRVFA